MTVRDVCSCGFEAKCRGVEAFFLKKHPKKFKKTSTPSTLSIYIIKIIYFLYINPYYDWISFFSRDVEVDLDTVSTLRRLETRIWIQSRQGESNKK